MNIHKAPARLIGTPFTQPSSIRLQAGEANIPIPRQSVQRRMQELATLLGGPVERVDCSRSSSTQALFLPLAQLLILGTACAAPLLRREAEETEVAPGLSTAIVRLDRDRTGAMDFCVDLLPAGQGTWLERQRLWKEIGGSRFWLVPSQGEGRSARMSPWCIDLIARAPFYSLAEREAGFRRAAEAMTAVREAK